MKTKLLLSIIIFVISVALSCGKKDETIPTTKEPYGSMSDFFLKNGAATQIFTINASSGGTIIGSQGTKITFPAYAFKHLNGNSVSGNVSIVLKEVYKKSDMLLTKISTSTYNEPLTSGGMFYLMPYQGNERLTMATGKSYSATVIAANPDPAMSAYITASADTPVNWIAADTSAQDSYYYGYSYYATVLDTASGYIWSSNWLGWANCDHPWTSGTTTAMQMQGTDIVSDYSTFVFLIFKGNTAIQPYPDYSNSNAFMYNYAPLDSSATLVAVGLKDSVLYSSFVPVTITNNLQVNFTLEKTTTDDFKAALDLLN